MSQAALEISTTPPLSGTSLVAQINAMIAALASLSSGASAPTQGPGAANALVPYQLWMDTTNIGGSPATVTLKMYDGTAWQPLLKFDLTNSTFLPLNNPTPVNATDSAPKSYVDAQILALSARNSVKWGTAAVLPNSPTYANGSAGVGATLTAGSNATLTVDGNTVALNDRVLVRNQATAAQNGIYTCTAAGSGAAPWVLTRATDANQASNILPGIFCFCEAGTANAGHGFQLTTIGAITVGSTSLAFTQFTGGGLLTTASSNRIQITGNQLDLGTAANVQAYLEQGITLLNVLTASNSATLDDTTSFTSAYDDYLIVLDNLTPVTNGVALELLVHSNAAFQNTSYLNASGSITTYIDVIGGAAANAGSTDGISAHIYLQGANSSVHKFIRCLGNYLTSGSAVGNINGSGLWNGGTTAIDGVRFLFASGNISSGSIKIYSIRKAL